MRLAFSTLGCPAWSLEQAAEAALKHGYAGLELRLLDGELLKPDLDPAGRRRVSEVCRAAGLEIVAVDSGVRIAVPGPAARAEVEAGLAMIDLAAGWGSGLLRVFGAPPEGLGEADALAASVETLATLAARGAEAGVAVVLETHDFFSSSAAVRRVLDRVPGPGAGALWDTLHPCRVGESPAQTLERLGERLLHVHVKDGRPKPTGGEHWDLTPLGDGAVPMPDILAALRGAGYSGWLSVEWEKFWHPSLAEPELALPQHAARLREQLAALG